MSRLRLSTRLGAVERLGQRIPAPPCLVCRAWGPVAWEDPWPTRWPVCGRVTTLVCIIGVDGEAL